MLFRESASGSCFPGKHSDIVACVVRVDRLIMYELTIPVSSKRAVRRAALTRLSILFEDCPDRYRLELPLERRA